MQTCAEADLKSRYHYLVQLSDDAPTGIVVLNKVKKSSRIQTMKQVAVVVERPRDASYLSVASTVQCLARSLLLSRHTA